MCQSLMPQDPRALALGVLEQIRDATGAALDYEPFAQNLDATGDGTGSIIMKVDGSTPVTFKITAQAGQKLRIARLVIQIYHNTQTFDYNLFGQLAALANGCSLVLVKTSGNIDLAGGKEIKRNYDFTDIGFMPVAKSMPDSDWHQFELNCQAVYGTFLKLDVDDAAELQFIVNDDISGLSLFQMFATGFDQNASY